jgi:hydrogenase nickel incorporation protein HypA/HybF
MHELGVVFHCIKEINEIAAENKVKHINRVTVQIGEVSTVIPYYFEDCWNWAVKKETVLKDAKLVVEIIPAVTHCEHCNQNYPTVQHGKTCPHCGSGDTYLLTGNEILIKEIEVVDEDTASENTSGETQAVDETNSVDESQ